MTKIVWAPGNLIVATNEGVDVRFAGVEITAAAPGHVGLAPGERVIRVDLAGVTSSVTIDLDRRHLQEMEAWAEDRKLRGAENTGRPPAMPGETVLSAVRAIVTDSRDTEYRQVAGRVAGAGSGWDASWMFSPEPPAGVKHLTVEFTLNGELTGNSIRVQLD